MKSFFLLLMISGLCLTNIIGQSVSLKGLAPGTGGESIEIFRFTDLVTRQLELLDRVLVADDENFKSEINSEGIQWIQIRYGIFDLLLLVEEGGSYELSFPVYRGLSKADRLNPFFEYSIIHIPDSDKQSLNNALRRLDSLYYEKLNLITTDIYLGGKKVDYDSVAMVFTNSIPAFNHSYYQSYSDYRNYLIELIGRGDAGKSKCITKLNQDFNPVNPACIDLFQQLFNGYIKRLSLSPKAKEIKKHINVNSSLDEIRELVMDEGDVYDMRLFEFLVLQNLYREFYDGGFSKQGIMHIIQWMSNKAGDSYSRKLAGIIYEKIINLRPGSRPPDFSLADADGNIYKLDSLSGKYSILIFAESDSWLSMSELRVLKTWYAEYKDDLSVITILLDEDFSKALERMRREKLNWIILDGSASKHLLRKYDVRYIPAFYLLNRESRIIKAPSILPSENLRSLIMQQLQQELIDNLRN